MATSAQGSAGLGLRARAWRLVAVVHAFKSSASWFSVLIYFVRVVAQALISLKLSVRVYASVRVCGCECERGGGDMRRLRLQHLCVCARRSRVIAMQCIACAQHCSATLALIGNAVSV